MFVGSNEFSLRYLSVLLSILSVPLVVAIGKRFVNSMVGYAAAMLLAVSPYQIYYAQEVRMYSLLGTLALLSSWIYLRWMAIPSTLILVLQAFLYVALAYTHYSGLFVPATHATIAIFAWIIEGISNNELSCKQRAFLRISSKWIVSWVGCGILFMPWVLTNIDLMAENIAGGTSKSILQIVAATLIELTFGHHVFAHLDATDQTDATVLHSLTLLSLLIALCFVLAILPQRTSDKPVSVINRLVVIAHALVPYTLLTILVQVTREFVPRYAFPATPWFPIAISAGLWRAPRTLRGVGLVVLLGYHLWGTILYFEHPGLARLDFRTAAMYIANQQQPNDIVLITAPHVVPTVNYYRSSVGLKIPELPVPPSIPLDRQETESLLLDVSRRYERVWYLQWQDYFSDPSSLIEHWFDRSAIRIISQPVGSSYSGSLRLSLWLTRPPILTSVPTSSVPVNYSLGEDVRLVGYEIQEIWPNTLTIDLYWNILKPMAIDYTVFVHLLDDHDRRVAQGDSQPYGGRFPTTRWPVGTIIKDSHQLRLDACIPAGSYQLDVGLYDLKTMQRLGPPESNTVHIAVRLERPPLPVAHGRILSLLPEVLQLRHRLPYGLGASC
jgi:sulfur transfer complex TusBCD TusB component (DsrH family)